MSHSHYNLTLMDAARFWLGLGAALVPCQPGSKELIRGYGPYQQRIRTENEALFWWGSGRFPNLAVVCGTAGLICLDFDDLDIYEDWAASAGSLASTYQEKTRRGRHVFFQLEGDTPIPVLNMIAGVDLPKVILAAPSVHPSGFQYQAVDTSTKVLSIDDWRPVFAPLLLSEIPDPGVYPSAEKLYTGESSGLNIDVVNRIKDALSVLELARLFTDLESSDHGAGRWYMGLCPFHDDENPSFWVDAERGLWGCYACKAHGDLINLYANWHTITVQDAIKALAREVLA